MYNSIGLKIKEIRKANHLTQEEMGKICGVSGKAVWTWENGTATPTISTIEAISRHFGILKSEIIEEDKLLQDEKVQDVLNAMHKNENLLALFHKILGVKDNDIIFINDLVERLI